MFSLGVFTNWINMVTVWVALAVIFIIVAPAVEEIRAAYTAYRSMKVYVSDMSNSGSLQASMLQTADADDQPKLDINLQEI